MHLPTFSLFSIFLLLSGYLLAQKPSVVEEQVVFGNPIIRHIRSADPSAQVWNDGRVWVYTSHDQDDAVDYSSMDGYHAFSSYDMINWTDHGEILHSRDVSWGVSEGGWMFAPDAAYKNGIYYLYFPTMAKGWKWKVGVATSEKPEGPFTDVGYYIEGTDHIDPICFVDEDGQAYLIWGGDFQRPRIARLKDNMTELAEEPRFIEYGAENFGEGGFMHKRDGVYYFSYTCQSCYPYGAFYAMGDNPYGPFEYIGPVKKPPPGAQDHHSMVEFHGQWYYFYHTGNYKSGSLFRRNVCVDSLNYNQDGTMQVVVQTTTGVGQDPIGAAKGIVVPGRIEAEDYFRQSGIDTLQWGDSVGVVTDINHSDCFDFVLEVLSSETYSSTIKVSDPLVGSTIYLLIDEVAVDTFHMDVVVDTLKTELFFYQGKHTLKLLFESSDTASKLMDVDWIDLYGETEYRRIKASSTEGGSILPEGTLYVLKGDSSTFSFDWEVDYRPDSLSIDGICEEMTESYTFQKILENHTIEARFAACLGTLLTPVVGVNEEDILKESNISVVEGETLKLGVEYQGTGHLTWILPSGQYIKGDELQLDHISTTQGGAYSAVLINELGCKSRTEFVVTVKPLVLEVYQAERWSKNHGTQSEICTDAGGTHHLTFIENNDWCSYEINLEEPGIYDVTVRVATAMIGGEIEFSVDDKLLATVPVSASLSDGWQDWYTTAPLEASFEKENIELKLTFKGGEGYLFNVNWFDLEFNRTLLTSVNETKEPPGLLYCHPNPNGPGIRIKYTLDRPADVSINIIDAVGKNCRNLLKYRSLNEGTYEFAWDGRDDRNAMLSDGIYLLIFTANNHREVQKFILVK